MSSVYGNSTINITASGAPDGRFGCFLERERSSRCQVELDTLHECVPFNYSNYMDESPITSRAWVMQERLLSPRALHFTRHEIFWECAQAFSSETFTRKIPPGLTTPPSALQSLHRTIHDGYDGWMEFIERYSSCRLTHKSDKLVAISGIAQAVHAFKADDYLAGIWKRSLLPQICFLTESSDNKRMPIYVAPTWSWASLDCSVEFPSRRKSDDHQDVEYIPHVTDVSVAHTSDDAFGQVSDARLHLRTPALLRVEVARRRESSADADLTLYQIAVRLITGQKLLIRAYPDAGEGFEVEDPVYLLPIAIARRQENVKNFLRTNMTNGLILAPTGVVRGQYKRAGFFSFSWESETDSEEERYSYDEDESRMENGNTGEMARSVRDGLRVSRVVVFANNTEYEQHSCDDEEVSSVEDWDEGSMEIEEEREVDDENEDQWNQRHTTQVDDDNEANLAEEDDSEAGQNEGRWENVSETDEGRYARGEVFFEEDVQVQESECEHISLRNGRKEFHITVI